MKFGPEGALYVAEAGRGGSTPAASFDCDQVPGPVGPYFGGRTARISKISGAGQRSTVVDGLPSSISSLPSGDTVGAADVAFVDGKLFALLAGGGCSHGNPATPNGVIQVDAIHHTWHYVANLSAFLKANPPANPGPSLDDWEPDGTWYSMIAVNGSLYATEPNHQELDSISPTTGAIHRVVDVSASSSTWVGPTGLVFHGSNFFFGNLAPFPIVPGSSSIFKLSPSGSFELLHPGFTTVVGLVFGRNNSLYVLELSAAPGFPNPGAGKIVRISASTPSGGHTNRASGSYGNDLGAGRCPLRFEFWRRPARTGADSSRPNSVD